MVYILKMPAFVHLLVWKWLWCNFLWALVIGYCSMHTAMHSLRLQRLLWIYCRGHAGVSGNERVDRLASTADITSGLQLGRAEVLRGLRNFLSTDKPEHHSIDRLKESGVEKGSGQHSTLQGWERSVFNQTNIGTVSRTTLGRLLRDGAERVWAFPSATMPSWAETETETVDWNITAQNNEKLCAWNINQNIFRQNPHSFVQIHLIYLQSRMWWRSRPFVKSLLC